MISFVTVSLCTGCIAAIAWHSHRDKGSIITKFFLIINTLNLAAYLIYIGKSIGFFGYDTLTEHITEFVYVIEFIAITIAITRYHEQLKVSYSRYKGISEVAGMIAHDVRKPFSRIVSFLDLIPQVVKDPRAQKFIQSLDTELRDDIQKIRTTLEEIIELNASKPLEMRPSYLPDVAHESLIESITFTQSEGVQIKTKFVGHCTAMVDPHELKRVFSNLITNALEMMKEGDILEISMITEDSSINTEVRNTGTSIDKNDLPKIFDFSFSKGKPSGHGLGLAVVKKIIGDHDSSIRVSSTSDSVTFSFSLPTARTSVKPEREWPKQTKPHPDTSY